MHLIRLNGLPSCIYLLIFFFMKLSCFPLIRILLFTNMPLRFRAMKFLVKPVRTSMKNAALNTSFSSYTDCKCVLTILKMSLRIKMKMLQQLFTSLNHFVTCPSQCMFQIWILLFWGCAMMSSALRLHLINVMFVMPLLNDSIDFFLLLNFIVVICDYHGKIKITITWFNYKKEKKRKKKTAY